MKLEETIKIIKIVKSSYPRFYDKVNAEDFNDMIDTWNLMLEEYDYPNVQAGLISFIKTDTSGFPPSVGQIVAMMPSVRNDTQATIAPLEAWALVAKAIGNSNYHSEEEFEKLPPLIQKAVGNPATLREWAAMDSNTVHSVEQSNFLRTYEALMKRAKDDIKLPPEFRLRLEGVKVEAIEDKQSDEVKELLRQAHTPTDKRASAEEIDRMMKEASERIKG